MARRGPAGDRGLLRWLETLAYSSETLAYSSVWVALAAGALCAAAGRALAGQVHAPATALAMSGTLAVYNLDRLRDLARDRVTAPRRCAFVARHRRALTALAAAAAALGIALAAALGTRAVVVLVPVLLLGMGHRRLKRFPYAKPLYVAASWVVVTAVLPALLLPGARGAGWVMAIFGGTIVANVIACNVRDGEAVSAAWGAGVPLRLARGSAAGALLLSLLSPAEVRSLLWVPLTTLAALLGFRAGERYGHLVVDGALLVGGLAAFWSLGR